MKKNYLLCLVGAAMLCLSGQAMAADGAGYVGAKTCLGCHEKMTKTFEKNIHSKAKYWDAGAKSCESCHGPGSSHAESGDPAKIQNPAKLSVEDASKACLSCHKNAMGQRYWQGSAHESMNVSCVACHSVHNNNGKMLKESSEAATCYKCHPEQRSFSMKRSSHPMRDSSKGNGQGKMSCSSCHNAHGTQTGKLIAANSINDKCYECHQEKKAPVLWEHSPVKESCLNCHSAHGSNHEKMLTAKEPRLCQQCHEQGRHQTLAGEAGSFFVINRGCSNCHAQIHGSNHPSGQKLKR